MKEHEQRIYDELMKLPQNMLVEMCLIANVLPPRFYCWKSSYGSSHGGVASKDDAARALVPYLFARDFMRL